MNFSLKRKFVQVQVFTDSFTLNNLYDLTFLHLLKVSKSSYLVSHDCLCSLENLVKCDAIQIGFGGIREVSWKMFFLANQMVSRASTAKRVNACFWDWGIDNV